MRFQEEKYKKMRPRFLNEPKPECVSTCNPEIVYQGQLLFYYIYNTSKCTVETATLKQGRTQGVGVKTPL